MFKNILNHLGIENYGIISICLFFAVFVVALLWALFQRQSLIEHMETLPLDGGEVVKGDPNHE